MREAKWFALVAIIGIPLAIWTVVLITDALSCRSKWEKNHHARWTGFGACDVWTDNGWVPVEEVSP